MLVKYVDIHPHTIREKSKIILEHFINHTSRKVSGKARAMLVTRSRLHCVKYKLEFDKQMKEMGLAYRCLVGFSGTVHDKDSGIEYTESSMNGFPDRLTQENFKDPKHRILIVCDKFQTGFDEPLLHTMYVDKRLQGLQCVQTLSRLNRTMSGKTDTFVLDFVNKAQQVQESFQPYYQGTILSEETDPNKLYSIEQEIRKYNLITVEIVNHFTKVFYDECIPQERLQGILDSVVQEWRSLTKEEREDFRHQIQSFIRLYGYISQIISFKDINLEKLYIFLRYLNRKLPKRDVDPILTDVFASVDLEYFRIEKKGESQIKLDQTDGELPSISEVTGGGIEDEPKDWLSHIIKNLNDSFGSDLTEDDRVNLEKIEKRLQVNEELKKVHLGDNTESNRKYVFKKVFDEVVLSLLEDNIDFYKTVTEKNRNEYLIDVMYQNYLRGSDFSGNQA